MIQLTVKVRTPGLSRLDRVVRSGFAQGSHPAIDAMFNQWSRRYERFTRERFIRNSRGGGEWPPLAPSTIAKRLARRNAGRKRGSRGRARIRRGAFGSVLILRDTGALFNSLRIGSVGNKNQRVRNGVRFGFQPIPQGKGRSRATLTRIAGYHQTGGPNLPRRRIIVRPDQNTLRGMEADATRAITRVLRGGA